MSVAFAELVKLVPAWPAVTVSATVVPDVVGSNTIATLALSVPLPCAPSEPRVHLSVVPVSEQLPWLGVAETKVALEGMLLVSVTPEALVGAVFLTVAVKVVLVPTLVGDGVAPRHVDLGPS